MVASRGLLGGREKIRSRVFTIEGLQPSWLGGRAKCVAYGIVVILTIGLITGFVVGLSTGLIAAPIVGMGDSLVIALIFGTLFGLIAGAMEATGGIAYPGGLSFDLFGGLGAVPLLRIAAVETLSWKWNQFWKMTIPGSITGLIGGLLTGLNDAVLNGLNAGIYAGLNYGIAVGLIIMLCGGFTYRVKAEKASANQGIKLSLKNSLVVLLVTSLTVGLIIDLIGSLFRGQIGGVWGWRVFRQLAAPIVGLSVGLIVGLNRGGPPRSSTISYD